MLALDPLLEGGLLWTPLLIVIAKVAIIFVLGLVSTMLMIWYERKVVSGMHNRVGPNKAGPWGILQSLADGIKAFFKEDLLPSRADRIVFRLAPFLSFVPGFLIWSVIPLGGDFSDGRDGTVEIFGQTTRAQLADPPMGILIVLALSGIAVYGIMLAGWSSGSKYPLLGSVRASAQMISYEAALGLSLAAVLLSSGTLSTAGIVAGQDSFVDWNVISTGIVPFVIFLIAATAELNRPPFDLVEAEQELVGGFNTEYSGIRFALFFLAEFMGVVTMSAVMVTLFFGGPQGAVRHPADPRSDRGHAVVLREADGVLVPVRLAACHAATAALRPADGLRLEDPDPDRARLVPAARRAARVLARRRVRRQPPRRVDLVRGCRRRRCTVRRSTEGQRPQPGRRARG